MRAMTVLWAGFAALALVAAVHAGDEKGAEHGGVEAAWSEESNGLRGRLAMRRGYVFNGTGMVITHLELENVSNIGNAMILDVEKASLAFTVTDAEGKEVRQTGGAFSGLLAPVSKLILPVDSSIRFRLGPCGWGVPGDQAALVDLGVDYGWALPKDGKRYYLRGVLEIGEEKKKKAEGYERRWHGRLELPPVLIPTEPIPHDPATAGPLIEKLGAQMLSKNSRESDRAVQELSLIDDPRVVPWYVKAVESDDYSLKFAGLDRLARLEGDEALAGLKIGAATTGEHFGSDTKKSLAKDLAGNIRHKAVHGLARSSHPQAREVLFTMLDDGSSSVRLAVLQSVAKLDTPEGWAALEQHANDPDQTIRGEVKRMLKVRQGAGKPAGDNPGE